MATQADRSSRPRIPLSRERVLEAAVELADQDGIELVSMRNVAEKLGVKAMSLYNHVASKEDLLDGMVETVMSEVDPSSPEGDWKDALRHRILSAREAIRRHPWATSVLESRTEITPRLMEYMDSSVAILVGGGFSYELVHHAMHVLGSRLLGFTQELFNDGEALDGGREAELALLQTLAPYPNISTMLREISHDDSSIIGSGCDDDVEFIFGLDLILDGLERLRNTA